MNEREFNLLDEPWIIVLNFDGSTEKVSLIDALARSAEFRGLAGELPTQDAAILRLLLAVLHTVIARCGPSDNKDEHKPITDPLMALDCWKELWNAGSFPMESIRAYLEKYHDRFYLFDPERPFFQVPNINGKSTVFEAQKLNGEICESGHKPRLFSPRSGKPKEELEYDEAARWLVHVNSYSDSAFKDKDSKQDNRIGVGWLGKVGLVMAEGDTLFKTLMLNLILLKDGEDELWGDEKPIWENESVRTAKNMLVSAPSSLSELYTFQSRRIIIPHNEKVTEVKIAGGEAFEIEDALVEQMTLWKGSKKRGTLYKPRTHDASKQMWRNFAALLSLHDSQTQRCPGIVKWHARLAYEGILPNGIIRLRATALQYDSNNSSTVECYTDNMEFSGKILEEKGEKWVQTVIDSVKIADKLAERAGYLAQKIAEACGARARGGKEDDFGKTAGEIAKERAYSALDMPFRSWLAGIGTEHEKPTDAKERWWNTAQPIIRRLGKDIIAQAGPQAFVSKTVKGKYVSGVERYNDFLYCTKSWQTLMNGGKKSGK